MSNQNIINENVEAALAQLKASIIAQDIRLLAQRAVCPPSLFTRLAIMRHEERERMVTVPSKLAWLLETSAHAQATARGRAANLADLQFNKPQDGAA